MMNFDQHTAIERPVTTGDDRKVEVTVDGDKAVIRKSTYVDGIGWSVQKTIPVDANILDGLVDQLVTARGKIKRDGDDILSADILDF
jgi:hypothetical protein